MTTRPLCKTCHLPIWEPADRDSTAAFCTGRGRHGESATLAGPAERVATCDAIRATSLPGGFNVCPLPVGHEGGHR